METIACTRSKRETESACEREREGIIYLAKALDSVRYG